VRVLAATHRDLETAARHGAFREDLFYRLNVVPIHLAPLRERPADFIPLAEHFLFRATESRKQLGADAAARSLSHIPYGAFAVSLWPVAAAGLGLAALLIALIYPGEFLTRERLPAIASIPARHHTPLVVKSSSHHGRDDGLVLCRPTGR
jgi:DNA-binding NtrC family response regulator